MTFEDSAEDESDSDESEFEDSDAFENPIYCLARPSSKEPQTGLDLSFVKEETRTAFSGPSHSDEFQQAQSFQREIYLAVEDLTSVELMICHAEIRPIFGIGKGTVTDHWKQVSHSKKMSADERYNILCWSDGWAILTPRLTTS
jgi:hypothetical protein